jgi:predicted esterase
MKKMTLSDVQRDFWRLYGSKDYAQALELVQQAMIHFPDDWRLYNWRMCTQALLNETSQALQTLKEALDRGYWCDPALLHDDEDLKSLQGVPEYEQLVERCQRMFAQAQTDVKSELIVLSPEKETARPSPLLIALHGNSGNAHDFADNWRSLTEQGWVAALPQSSQLMAPGAFVWDDFTRGTQALQEHYAALIEQYAIDPERVILAGFSRGGGLAIHLAVTGALKTRGFVVIGPSLPDLDTLLPFVETVRTRGVRGYIVLGLQESPAGLEQIRKTAEFLNAHGIPTEVEEHADLGHAFPANFAHSLERALAYLL